VAGDSAVVVTRRPYPCGPGTTRGPSDLHSASMLCPVARRLLRGGRALRRLETWRQCCIGPRQHLVMFYVQQPQPALLTEGERNEAAKLHQLRLAEMPVQPCPQVVIVRQVPRDCLRIGQSGLLPLVETLRAFEVQQLVVFPLAQPL
jgi:hypothetical protein